MVEIIPVVNRNDEIIGHRKRGEEKAGDICRITALWIVNYKKQILLAQRSFNKKYSPGKWGPSVAGTVARGEKYLESIIKETKEEISLDLTKYTVKKIDKTFNKTEHSFFCQWYFLQVDIKIEELIFPKDEVRQLKLVDVEEFKKDLELHPSKYTTNMKQHFEILKKY